MLDTTVLTGATEAATIRVTVGADALSCLVKPFPPAELAARLAGYARYRRSCLAPTSPQNGRRPFVRITPEPVPTDGVDEERDARIESDAARGERSTVEQHGPQPRR